MDRQCSTYHKLCPNPTKDKEDLPEYWQRLNNFEKQKWLNENIINEDIYYDGEI